MLKERKIFETASVPTAVLALSLPTIAGMAVKVVYNMADMIFVGMTGDSDQIAVITVLMPASVFFMSVSGIFGIGGSSYVSRLLGAGSIKEAARASSFCFYAGLFTGLCCTVLGLLFLPQILLINGVSGDITSLAESYGRIVILGAAPTAVDFTLGQLMRARGGAREVMKGMSLGAVSNLILDPIFILILGLGARGAAIAAIAADIISVVYYFSLFRRDEVLSLRPSDFTLDRGVVTGVLAIGLPACLANLVGCFTNVWFNRLAISYGDHVVAAFGVASRVLMIPNMMAMALAKGAQPLVGYSFAAGDMHRMRQTVRFAGGMGTLACIGFAFFVYFRSGGLIGIFTNDPDVVWLGTVILNAMTLAIPVFAVETVLITAFQAMGKALVTLVLCAGRQLLVFLPLMILAERSLGLAGLILLEPLMEWITLFLALGFYHRVIQCQ